MNIKEKTVEQFDKWAPSYEQGIWRYYFNASYEKTLSEAKSILVPGSKILDLGCGTGEFTARLERELDARVIGVDISPQMIAVASMRSVPGRLDFICSDVEDLNLPEDTFDAVFCLNSFHHYANHSAVLQKINSLLKSNGLFFLLDPYEDSFLRGLWSKWLKLIFKEPHVKYFKKPELHDIAKNNRFEVEQQQDFIYFTLLSVFKRP